MSDVIVVGMWTAQDYQSLKAAIATGARRVEYQDKTVEYRTLAEMLLIKRAMEQELGIRGFGTRRTYASASKGVRPC